MSTTYHSQHPLHRNKSGRIVQTSTPTHRWSFSHRGKHACMTDTKDSFSISQRSFARSSRSDPKNFIAKDEHCGRLVNEIWKQAIVQRIKLSIPANFNCMLPSFLNFNGKIRYRYLLTSDNNPTSRQKVLSNSDLCYFKND